MREAYLGYRNMLGANAAKIVDLDFTQVVT